MKRVIIAGVSSGVGKTTISMGIMRALMRRGRKVIPFKTGPDYIDTGFHHAATGRASVNLDLWMTGEENTKFMYALHSNEGDFAVIEGVMGLYDGLGDERSTGSTAHLAKVIQAPVILIMDGSHMAASAAAVVLGFKEYDRDVPIRGIIVNNVSSEYHYRMIEEAITRTTGIPCLGYLPNNPKLSVPSRHLGLLQQEEIENIDSLMDEAASFIEKHIDLDLLEKVSEGYEEETLNIQTDPRASLENICRGLKLGLARDDAFSFYYEDNIRLLEYMGFEMIPFSPLHDSSLPDDLDAIYLGGGYPELYGETLSGNRAFLDSIRAALDQGIPTYAECGGYMYLMEGIEDSEGKFHKMTGFFDGYSKLTKSLQRFGYAEVRTESGINFKGHEFHHSRWTGPAETPLTLSLSKPRELGNPVSWECGQKKGNVHGAYVHIHFYSNLEAVKVIARDIFESRRSRDENSTNQKTD